MGLLQATGGSAQMPRHSQRYHHPAVLGMPQETGMCRREGAGQKGKSRVSIQSTGEQAESGRGMDGSSWEDTDLIFTGPLVLQRVVSHHHLSVPVMLGGGCQSHVRRKLKLPKANDSQCKWQNWVSAKAISISPHCLADPSCSLSSFKKKTLVTRVILEYVLPIKNKKP